MCPGVAVQINSPAKLSLYPFAHACRHPERQHAYAQYLARSFLVHNIFRTIFHSFKSVQEGGRGRVGVLDGGTHAQRD